MQPNLKTHRQLTHSRKEKQVVPHVCGQVPMFSSREYADDIDAKALAAREAKGLKGGTLLRPVLRNEPLGTFGDITVTQLMGEQLDQGDADVYYHLVHRALLAPELPQIEDASGKLMDAPVVLRVSAKELLDSLGRSDGGTEYTALDESITRLLAATFKLEVVDQDFRRKSGTHLVTRYEYVETLTSGAKMYEITLDKDFAKLHQAGWSLESVAERQALSSQLAKALHAFFVTQGPNIKGKPWSMPELLQITGRGALKGAGIPAVRMDKFVSSIQKALAELEKICGWSCSLRGKGAKAKLVVDHNPPKAVSVTPSKKRKNPRVVAGADTSKELIERYGYARAMELLTAAGDRLLLEDARQAAARESTLNKAFAASLAEIADAKA